MGRDGIPMGGVEEACTPLLNEEARLSSGGFEAAVAVVEDIMTAENPFQRRCVDEG